MQRLSCLPSSLPTYPRACLLGRAAPVYLAWVSRWHLMSSLTGDNKVMGPQVCRPSLYHRHTDKNSSAIVWEDNVIRRLCLLRGKLGGFLCFRRFKRDILTCLIQRALWDVKLLCPDAAMDLGWRHRKQASLISEMCVSQAYPVYFLPLKCLSEHLRHISQTSLHRFCSLYFSSVP